jgi:tellurite resistance protein TerC
MTLLWIGFFALILSLLALDLGVLNRKAHEIKAQEALRWTAFWIALSLLFNVAIYFMYEYNFLGVGEHPGAAASGREAALKFFTGYVIEKSLSLDNIFVIALIFNYFKVPLKYQHRTLFWGVVGALVLRGAMIMAGSALIMRLEWMIYVFGILLLLTAVKLLFQKHDDFDPSRNPLVKIARKVYPVTPDFEGQRFFSRINGRRAITPLFLVLIVVESSDVLFAVDSIPAIFAVTLDPFIVFTSNVFAILGLRALYFALAAIMGLFAYLKFSLVFILAFVGVKMLLSHHHPIPVSVSLAVIAGALATGIAASVIAKKKA